MNELDLISRKKLLEEFEWLESVVNPSSKEDVQNTIQRIKNAKSVDAVVLPCKIGNTVYRVAAGNYSSDYEPFVEAMRVTEISWKFQNYSDKDLGFAIIANGIRYRFSSIGKSVFLTKEEAEKYLESLKK